MIIDRDLIDSLLSQAASSPRLRTSYDLRTSSEDSSQRMLNAMMPGTCVPIHRHKDTAESVFVIAGSLAEVFYDENGNETERFILNNQNGRYGVQIPAGQWHTVVITEPCVIIEVKDGAYMPLSQDDIM